MMVDGKTGGEVVWLDIPQGVLPPPLRPSPCRPPGVIHMIIPRRKNLTIHGPWNGKSMPVTGLTVETERVPFKKAGMSPYACLTQGLLQLATVVQVRAMHPIWKRI